MINQCFTRFGITIKTQKDEYMKFAINHILLLDLSSHPSIFPFHLLRGDKMKHFQKELKPSGLHYKLYGFTEFRNLNRNNILLPG